MADVRDGLSVGEETGLDPNDPRDFEKIMEDRGVPKEAGEGQIPSTDIRAGLTTEEPGQAREPESGRFAPAESKTPPTAAPDTSQVSVNEADLEPEVAAYLAKYDNDPAAALRAAANQTALIGRQGQELGQTREELAELRGRLEEISRNNTAPAVTLSQDQVEEQSQELVGSVGYVAAATQAANIAHQTGDERLYNSVRELWALEQPGAAMDFNTDFRMWQRDQRVAATASPEEPEPWMVSAREAAQVGAIETSLRAALDGFSDEDVESISGQFDAAMASMPPNVLQMVGSSDPEARDAGIKLVVDRATVLASKAPAPKAEPVVEKDPVLPDSAKRKLAGAAVATGALRPQAKTAATPETREEAIKDFKRQIVEAETTNVSSGLTYGPSR